MAPKLVGHLPFSIYTSNTQYVKERLYMNNKASIFLIILGTLTTACAHDPDIKKSPIVLCEDPRPQICTMDYTPVCGLKAKDTLKTYGNACGACSDVQVTSHIMGECQDKSLNHFSIADKKSKSSKS